MAQIPVWFIAAASSGFGKQVAVEALKHGHRVVATARNSSKLIDLKDLGAITMDLDVLQPFAELQKTVAAAHEKVGRFDFLINPPGYILQGALEETTTEEVEQAFRVNVFGVLNLTNAILPYMRAQKSGVIAHFGSVGSWAGVPAGGIYAATKWAISGLTESLALEVGSFGIKVCCVEPGYFRTGFLNTSATIIAKKNIPEYDETAVGAVKKTLRERDNQQLGDIEKGCKVLFEVLTQKDGKDIPIRLPLGSDAFEGIAGKCDATKALLEEWKDVICSTDRTES